MRSADVERRDDQHSRIVEAAQAVLDSEGTTAPRPLSRRSRWQVIAVDVRPDLAAVAVARRGKRAGLSIETHVFRRAGGEWAWADIGAVWDSEEVALPQRLSHDELTVAMGSAVAASGCDGIWTDLYQLPREAAWLREADRLDGVPTHGWVVRVRSGPKVPTDVLDVDEQVLGRLGAFHWR